jgi:hypothetical protein
MATNQDKDSKERLNRLSREALAKIKAIQVRHKKKVDGYVSEAKSAQINKLRKELAG